MERTPGLCTEGAPLDPAGAIREAAPSRGQAAAPLLERLARWGAKARREIAGDPEDGR